MAHFTLATAGYELVDRMFAMNKGLICSRQDKVYIEKLTELIINTGAKITYLDEVKNYAKRLTVCEQILQMCSKIRFIINIMVKSGIYKVSQTKKPLEFLTIVVTAVRSHAEKLEQAIYISGTAPIVVNPTVSASKILPVKAESTKSKIVDVEVKKILDDPDGFDDYE